MKGIIAALMAFTAFVGYGQDAELLYQLCPLCLDRRWLGLCHEASQTRDH
jgi:hypothetical protein